MCDNWKFGKRANLFLLLRAKMPKQRRNSPKPRLRGGLLARPLNFNVGVAPRLTDFWQTRTRTFRAIQNYFLKKPFFCTFVYGMHQWVCYPSQGGALRKNKPISAKEKIRPNNGGLQGRHLPRKCWRHFKVIQNTEKNGACSP